jgi:dolichol-phosphate mannosyltransferase
MSVLEEAGDRGALWGGRIHLLSVVIPCFNEAKGLPLLRHRLLEVLEGLPLEWEVIFVDDGSSDGSRLELARLYHSDPRFKVVSLSRNFGHQAAISAGLAHASGDAIAMMDADLQDPPELLPQCLSLLQHEYQVVYAIRRGRKENLLKRACYGLFYRALQFVSEIRMPLDAGDFCMIDRQVLNVLLSMPERNLYLRGMRAWAGFRQIGIEYDRPARAVGETKYSLRKLLHLAADGIFSFSIMPLRLATFAGLATVALGIVAGSFVLLWRILGFRFMGHTAAELPGWATLALGLLTFGGVHLLLLGIIGEYVGRIYNEVKRRPRYIVQQTLGLSASVPANDERLLGT